jgi:hypothetical protein
MATLKQSTAYTRAFFMVQSSDHVTALTGATPTATISKAGAAFGTGPTVAEIANGWYKAALTTAHTDTLGDLAVHVTATSGDPVDVCDQVVPVNASADIASVNGDAIAAANLAKTTRVIGRGTVSGTPSTTSVPTSAFAPSGSVSDQFKGRVITFDADTTTAALRGQSTTISSSTAAAAPTFTVAALTTAPAAGDTFSVT